MKTIAVLTSGGDAPGMNAAIRAVVRYGINLGLKVFGIENGFTGLIAGQIKPMDMRSVADIIQRGGTVLHTARCEEFKTAEGQKKAIVQLKKKGIEGLIVIGGNGSFMGAKDLCSHGFPAVGIPGTIDNDLAYTDYTLGFDTACNTALDAINKLRDTMTSHNRVVIVEVMGRNCGDLALHSGLGGGAEVIVPPEAPMIVDDILNTLLENHRRGKRFGVIVLAEGAAHAEDLQKELASKTKEISIRTTVLGHIQRGGSPSMRDRLLGTTMGVHAVELLKKGIGNRIVGIKEEKIFDMDIVEGCAMKKKINEELFRIAGIVAKG